MGRAHFFQRGLQRIFRALEGVLRIFIGNAVHFAGTLLRLADNIIGLLAGGLQRFAFGNDVLGVVLRPLAQVFRFFFGIGHIFCPGSHQFFCLFQLRGQLGADFVEIIQGAIALNDTLIIAQGHALGIVNHIV